MTQPTKSPTDDGAGPPRSRLKPPHVIEFMLLLAVLWIAGQANRQLDDLLRVTDRVQVKQR